MYHEEKVINGILCYRTTPNGKWHEFSKEELSQKLMDAREELIEKNKEIDDLDNFHERYNG